MFFNLLVIKWKHFPRYWPFVRGIHLSPGNSPHKCQWRGACMFTLICAWINGWVNSREAGDLRRHGAHYDVSEMTTRQLQKCNMITQASANFEVSFLSLFYVIHIYEFYEFIWKIQHAITRPNRIKPIFTRYTLKWKSCYCDEIFITGCTRNCQNDNF